MRFDIADILCARIPCNPRPLAVMAALLVACAAFSQETEEISEPAETSESADSASTNKKGFITKVIDYFSDANKEKKHKKFDFSILGGPHYSSDTKFGIGVVAAGVYGYDSLQPPSDVSLYGDVTTSGAYMLGIRGDHIARHDHLRLIYDTRFYSQPSKFWGVGHRVCDNDDNETDLKRRQIYVKAALQFLVAPRLYVGPIGRFDYIKVDHIEREGVLPANAPLSVTNNRFGFTVVYDSRDNLTAPQSGYYAGLAYYSRYLCVPVNDYDFDTVDLRLCGYNKLWKGAVLAYEYGMQMNWGQVPWCMMATIGGSYSMRGYYEGRYRDRGMMATQVELRQHVYRRSGIAIWAGAGIVYNKFSSMRFDDILPNCGIGYRWEFKKNVNVRLDFGIGKRGQTGFIFNINEAF